MATAENTELVDAFEQFYRNYYREEIGDLAQNYPGEKRSLYIDWDDLYRYDPDLADDFLSQPEQLQEYAEEALRIYDLPVDVSLGRAHVRLYNLPETTGIRDIRSRHVGQLLSVSGIVRKATDVRPKIEEAAFECQRCGTLNYIPQSSGDFQEPHECQGCERQGPFNVNFDQSEFVDAQKLRVQESPEGLRGGETPQAVDLTIEDDITGEVTAGDHVTVTGILHLQQQGNQQEKSPIFDIYMDGITVEIEDEQFEDMEISEEEKAEIIELSQSPDIYEKMIGSMAPSIYGYDQEKLAIILQLFSGVTKHLPDGSRIRGDLHLLLIGDPGTGKCVRGDTTVTLADGRERPIKEIVEANLTDPSPVDDGVYDSLDQDVVSLGTDGTSELRTATKVWKREAPDRMYRIRTASGYELEVTPSHPLFVNHPYGYEARIADELQVGDSIAISPDESDKPLATDGGAISEAAAHPDPHVGERSVEQDQIESIDAVEPDYDWVYDLEVEGTHSYLSNNVFSHNSQLLQYVREISPRSVYTSGKGSSAAGLCVTGDTFVHTKDGIRQIRDLATDKHPDPVDDDESERHHEDVYTFDREAGEMELRESSHVWRMPEKPCRRIETAHGKELEISVNTPVLVAGDAGIEWRPIEAVEPGDQVAVPSYDTVESSSPSVREFLEFTNEQLKPTDESIEFLRSQLSETFGTLRDAAKELDLSEDFIYDSLSNRFVPIDKLDRLLDAIDADRSDVEFERAMLRHGDPVDLPDEFSPDLLYLIGLVFGDGDISLARRGENRGMVRLSNSDEALLERAIDIIEREFGKTVEIERQTDRVPCIRLNSATVARLFANVGMQTPKAELSLDYRLTTGEHADAFLRGLFDADGCVAERDTGSSTIQFSTISETLAEQVQLMLETLGVRARSRERDRRGISVRADGFEIESKEVQTHLTIYGENRDRFAEHVGFESAAKAAALDRITGESDAPAETVPVGGALESIEVSTDQRYVNFNCGGDVARSTARSMIATAEPVVDTTPAEEVLDAELAWDEVVAAVDTGQKEVFDLTVPDTHNFVGNGIVTHNTAAAVRDDFGDGQQWTLEAGAMVLADKGVAAIDELDKMRCVTGDSLVHTQDGIRRIDEIAANAAQDGDIEVLENGRTIRDTDLSVWTLTDDERLVQRPVSAVHEYDAPEELLEVTLETGESVTVTPDHPFITLEDGDRTNVPAGDLRGEEWVYIPDRVPTPAADGGIAAHKSRMDVSTENGRLTPAHGAVLGYLAGDGNVFCDRDEGVYGIRFTNAEEQLIDHFESSCRSAFDAEPVRHPSDQRDGVMTTRLHGKEYLHSVLDAGMNLDVYDGKCLPEAVTRGSLETQAAFVRALADSDGSVGERCVKIHSSSYDLLLGVKMLLTEFGITSQLQHRSNEEKRDMYLLVITSDESLRRYNRRIGFTLDRKQAALEQACDRTTGDRTIVDVLPEIGSYLESMRDSLRLHVSECGLNDATYCNFENGDANVSFDCAEQILAAFEERRATAENDHERLSEELSWGELEALTERYHVSQSELATGTEYSQPQISRYWSTDDALRRTVQSRLSSIVEAVATTDLSRLRELVSGDVKWRRVESVSRVSGDDQNGNTAVLRSQLADLVNASPDDAHSTAQSLLQEEPILDSGDEIATALDRYGIPQWRVAEHLGVDQATVSRWIRDRTPHDSEQLRTACLELINQRKSRIQSQLTAIERRQETKVYDLTVEGTHNFLANGMVVHNSEDRSAMHEALEQQSYHPDTEVLLADGRRVEIGEFVDERIEDDETEVIDGVDCEIAPVEDVRVHSTDLDANETTKTSVDRVSRHEAPEEFVRVTFSNGRDVLVTPEHPMFVEAAGEIDTVEASSIEAGQYVPAPRKLPNSSAGVSLDDEAHIGKEKDVTLPDELSPDLAEILGLLTAEGHSYAGSSHEIGFSNQDERLLDRADALVSEVFEMESTDTVNGEGTTTKRWVSTKLYRWFKENFPTVMETARDKRIPSAVLGASEEEIRRFLVGAFAGDGGVESEAMSFSTASPGLAEDYADALSKIGVATRIHHDIAEDSWKTYVMGDSTVSFVEQVVDPTDERYDDACSFAERSAESPRHHDVLPPSAAEEIRSLRTLLGVGLTGQFYPNVDEGFGVQIETVETEVATLRERIDEVRASLEHCETVSEIRATIDWSCRQLADRIEGETTSSISYAEDGGYDSERRARMAEHAADAVRDALIEGEHRLDSLSEKTERRYYTVTNVETVPNEGDHECEWVYDVTVEPTNTFVSQGVVLHNSISISKAGINATLKSRCSLLGAANPKYGRFDQYESMGEQIDLEPALISRFDLIFTVTDQPDEEEDSRLADHILQTNFAGELNTQREEMSAPNVTREQVDAQTEEVEPVIEAELLRKYVAHAKSNVYPTMSDEAKEAIRDFYVDLRSKGSDEDAPVPVTARKLEALVRLAEASARVRLADTVEIEDAERVIEIVRSCLQDIGVDPETGQYDADVVETGTSKSQRDRIKNIKQLIADVEEDYDEGAPVDVVLERADEIGMDQSKAEKEIEKLKQKGEVYEPNLDHLRTA